MFTFSVEEVSIMITTEVFMDIISLHRQGFSMRAIAIRGKRSGLRSTFVFKENRDVHKITLCECNAVVNEK